MARSAHVYPGPGCPECGLPATESPLIPGAQRCRRCATAFTAALFSPAQPGVGQAPTLGVTGAGKAVAAVADGTPCVNHAGNAAATSCGRCGIFICDLCRIDSDGLVLCPACFTRLADEGALPSARRIFADPSRKAQTMAIFGLIPFLGMVMVPFTVFQAVKGLRQRARGETRISLIRCLVALGLCLAPIAWLVLLVSALVVR